ncbi:hypothetical protein [Roseibium alexandrii]|uniref:Uncharacterized protein n=1 Tax=Roseibium alexandrii (strain DSM 17067 / NCIMB 14079 / DFL-11) TaxID=244592 RepID=A0A5E8H1P6_ROSAD|nr:hypothetical protein [Roseibium alexandrii]EEE45731.1 hypothetical protein SADFL11_3020 [Roseibium alexandrii DFL-11]
MGALAAVGAVASAGVGIAGGMQQAAYAKAQGQANAEWAEYRRVINAQELDLNQEMREYEAEFTKKQMEIDRVNQDLQTQVAKWRTNFEYDAMALEHKHTTEAINESLGIRYDEYRRQQDEILKNAKANIEEVNEDASNKVSARVMMYQKELSSVRAFAGVSGTNTSTMGRKVRELAMFKGIDVTQIDRNRERAVTALRDNAIGKVEAINAQGKADYASAKNETAKMSLSLGMANARKNVALQIIDAGGKVNDVNRTLQDMQLEHNKKAGKVYTEWAKEAGVGTAQFEAQSARLSANARASGAMWGAIGSGLSILTSPMNFG